MTENSGRDWRQRFERIPDEMETFFGRMFDKVAESRETSAVAIDMVETADAFLITVEAPGVEPKEIDAELDGDVLVIRGEKKRTSSQGSVHLGERRFGMFERRVPLPKAADSEGVTARSGLGLLEIRVPKKNPGRTRKIDIDE